MPKNPRYEASVNFSPTIPICSFNSNVSCDQNRLRCQRALKIHPIKPQIFHAWIFPKSHQKPNSHLKKHIMFTAPKPPIKPLKILILLLANKPNPQEYEPSIPLIFTLYIYPRKP